MATVHVTCLVSAKDVMDKKELGRISVFCREHGLGVPRVGYSPAAHNKYMHVACKIPSFTCDKAFYDSIKLKHKGSKTASVKICNTVFNAYGVEVEDEEC